MASDRTKHAGIGAAITFVLGLGPAIPAFGLFLGPIFTFGGGLIGGGVSAGLHGRGGTEGVKIALIATFVGGLTSSVVASIGGTLLNIFIVSSDSASSSEPGTWIMFAIIGLITGMTLTLIGGLIGGAVGGFITAPDDA